MGGDSLMQEDSGKKPKRQMKTPFQLEALEKSFAMDQYPSEATRAELSEKLGLSDRQLQWWFCHRRLKEKNNIPNKKPLAGVTITPEYVREPLVLQPDPGSDYESGSGSGSSPYASRELQRVVFRRDGGDVGVGRSTCESPSPRTITELRAIACVEAQLGEPLREDGPILGMEFDPLPPDAFGAHIGSMEELRHSDRHYDNKAYGWRDMLPSKGTGRSVHEYKFLQDQPSMRYGSHGQGPKNHFHDVPIEGQSARTLTHGNEKLSRLHGVQGHQLRVCRASSEDRVMAGGRTRGCRAQVPAEEAPNRDATIEDLRRQIAELNQRLDVQESGGRNDRRRDLGIRVNLPEFVDTLQAEDFVEDAELEVEEAVEVSEAIYDDDDAVSPCSFSTNVEPHHEIYASLPCGAVDVLDEEEELVEVQRSLTEFETVMPDNLPFGLPPMKEIPHHLDLVPEKLNTMVQKRRVSSDAIQPLPQKRLKLSNDAVDSSEPFAILQVLREMEQGKYGSASADIEALIARKQQCLHAFITVPKASTVCEVKQEKEVSPSGRLGDPGGILPVSAAPIVIIDSDEEEDKDVTTTTYPFEGIFLPPVEHLALGTPLPLPAPFPLGNEVEHRRRSTQGAVSLNDDSAEVLRDKGEYVGVEEEDEESEEEDDGLGDVWKEMNLAIEYSKDVTEDSPGEDGSEDEEEEGEDKCDHSFVLKDDIGYVCRVCGVIGKGIESIVEYQYNKGKRSTRTYFSENQRVKDKDSLDMSELKLSAEDLEVTDIAAHPRHRKQMKPHQVEGFNFLVSNLVSENPGGCILAHAPGSGKTFMIISFMQSFLAKYPHARPLVILPKGILSTWKKEFLRWQVEDIPLLDFYTRKAEKRVQQLEVLKQWVDQRSILFLGYKQFATIVCEAATNGVSASCQEILLKAPSILILDEGHTPRNEDTDVLQSLAKIQTLRKVVLSGTLYQNHVKEVFNIVNLVRPKFLKLENSRVVMRRIMSTVDLGGVRKHGGAEAAFYEAVEHTLQKDMDLDRKVRLIKNLREMTHKILHYYKGDFLDELPGLVDYTVVLNLSGHQKRELRKLKTTERKFTVSARGSALYLHPMLDDTTARGDTGMDELLDKIDIKHGVKAKFFLNMLTLCECSGEKLLVFSQYLTPLKFMERLVVKARGWSLHKEIFVISGETNAEEREVSMDQFNNSPDSRVFFGSIKACGEGISLVGASRIIILDVHLNPSVTRQAIGRAFRPGQTKKVFAYRLVAADSPEEEDHTTCFKKEKISKMWFEWNEHCGSSGQFEIDPVDMRDCGDDFLENPALKEDVKALYKR